MKLSEIYKIADEIAPKALSDEFCAKYGAYDNSGILVDVNEEITGIVFALDLSEAAIDRAVETGANLIMTHHPAIYGKISKIDYFDDAVLGRKLVRCIRRGISVLCMHLNLDAAKEGIDESLAVGIALSAGGQRTNEQIHLPLTGGGYGRAYDIEKIPLGKLVEGMKATFKTERVEFYGEEGEKIGRVASFCGAGADEASVLYAKKSGADVIVSSDFKHHLLALAREIGLRVITLTHYAAEYYGFKKYYEKISRRVDVPCALHEDGALL